MSRIRTAGAACLAIVGMLVSANAAFPQMNGRQGGGGQGAMVAGEVTGIDDASLTVKTENGSTERLAISSSTDFVQESPADSSALAVGETVVVIGQPEGQGAIVPRMVRIVDKIDDMSRPRGQAGGGQMRQGGLPGGGPSQAPQGGQMMGGLVVGAVIGLDPLKIEQASGATTVAKLTESTRIMIEKSLTASQVSKGARVRVLAPSSPGSSSRQARKVIILPDAMAAPMR